MTKHHICSQNRFTYVIFACLFYSCLSFSHLFAQVRLDNWETYTSMLNIRAANSDSNGVMWVGTSGGVFSYNLKTSQFAEYRNIDALASLDITSLKINPFNNNVFVGTSDGVVSVFNGKSWQNITDIRDYNFSSPQINDFAFRDSTVYIAGNFGIATMNSRNFLFIETVRKVGTFDIDIHVQQFLIEKSRLWAATQGGVASISVNAPALADPKAWTIYSFSNEPSKNDVKSIASFKDSIYVASENIVWGLHGLEFDTVQTIDNTIHSLSSDKKTLYFVTSNMLGNLSGDGFRYFSYPEAMHGGTFLNLGDSTKFCLFFTTKGIGIVQNILDKNSYLNILAQNSPQSNQFLKLAIAPDGGLWNATDIDGRGSGFFRYFNNDWTNYSVDKYPSLQTNDYQNISTSPNGNVWASSWGRGLALLTPSADTFKLTKFNTVNSPLIDFQPGFLVIRAVQSDGQNNSWICNLQNRDLIEYDNLGKFHSFTPPQPLNDINDYFIVAFDNSGTKWLGTDAGKGLMYFNERGTPENTNDDAWGVVSSTQYPALSSDSQTALTIDKDGALWIGSVKGLYVISNPSAVLSKSRLFVRAVSALNGQVVNDVVVDAINQKWVATNSGIWVLNSDGTVVLQRISIENSPLLANTVRSLAINNKTGRIYFGTESGLFSVQTLSIQANTTFDNLRCYPQPFSPDQDSELTIEGLAESAEVRVTTIDGIVVRTLFSGGSRRVVWDGRNNNGNFVQSGVYLVSGYSETTNDVASVKVAVIRK